MKTFKEYLTESRKVYNFKIKVAGDLPENFVDDFKSKMNRCKVAEFKEIQKTPIQAVPLDFPESVNSEVRIFSFICEYPVTAPEIANELKQMGLDENLFRVRGSSEPSEVDQATKGEVLNPDGLLTDPEYKEGPSKVKHKDYFGNDFNKSFLKDLDKKTKERRKEAGPHEYKLAKNKQDKAGIASPVGSK